MQFKKLKDAWQKFDASIGKIPIIIQIAIGIVIIVLCYKYVWPLYLH